MRKLMILTMIVMALLLVGCQNQAPTGYAGYGGGYGGYQGGYQGQAPAQGGAGYAGYGCGVASEVAYENSVVIASSAVGA